MRTFTIRKGKYAGEHTIYESIEEAQRHNITPKSPWYTPDVEVGDWCLSDDGYVLRCLKRDTLVNKRHKSGQRTDYFRFCNGTFYVYYAKGGKRRIKNFYGVASANHKSSLGNTSALGKYMTLKKKHFVSLVGSGLDPYNAYIQAYNVHSTTKNNIWMQVNNLLSDPLIRKELMEQLKPVIQKLEQQIEKETGAATLQDWLVEELTKLLVKDKKLSSRDRRDNIRLIVNLFGEPLGLSTPKSNKINATDAEWVEVPPPQLGNNTEINYGNNPSPRESNDSSRGLNSDSVSNDSIREEQAKTGNTQDDSRDNIGLEPIDNAPEQDTINLEKPSQDKVD